MIHRWRKYQILILCLALATARSAAQNTAWEANHKAGIKAYQQGRYSQAEHFLSAAMKDAETLGAESQTAAKTHLALANLYYAIDRHDKAEAAYRQALKIGEKAFGAEDPFVADVCFMTGEFYFARRSLRMAEPHYQRALAIREKQSPGLVDTNALYMVALADLYRAESNDKKAQPLYRRAVELQNMRSAIEPRHAATLDKLANLYSDQRQYEQAQPLYQQALRILEKTLGPEHVALSDVLEDYATLLRRMKRTDEAGEVRKREQAIRMKYAQGFQFKAGQAVYVAYTMDPSFQRELLRDVTDDNLQKRIARGRSRGEEAFRKYNKFQVVDTVDKADFVFLAIDYATAPPLSNSAQIVGTERSAAGVRPVYRLSLTSFHAYPRLVIAVRRHDYLANRFHLEILPRRALWIMDSRKEIEASYKSVRLIERFHTDLFGPAKESK